MSSSTAAPAKIVKPDARPSPRSGRDLMIVGIGASAGGLDAFIQLIEALPPDSGLALVLIQHLSPKQHSALPTLLAPHTSMPVIEVTDGARIEANYVYVIPPNVQLEVAGDRLVLSPRPEDRVHPLVPDVPSARGWWLLPRQWAEASTVGSPAGSHGRIGRLGQSLGFA